MGTGAPTGGVNTGNAVPTAALLLFSPASKDFGIKATGSSTTQALSITNSGMTTATSVFISLAGASAYTLTSNQCGVTGTRISLASGRGCTFNIVFAPGSNGVFSGTVSLSYSNGTSTLTGSMLITGTGANPASLAFSPTSQAFGNVTVGASSTQSFTLTNSGGASSTGTYVSVAGTGYSLASNNCGTSGGKVTIAGAGSCTFSVVFSPSSVGAASGTISLSYSNGIATQTTPSVALTGTGIAAASLAFSPTVKAFGSKLVGSSTTQSVTITNSGDVSATSVYIAVTGTAGYSLANNNCGVTGARVSLAAAATCTFDIVFAPSATGAVSETVSLSYNNGAANQAGTMAVTGTGSAPASLAFSPTSKAFGNIVAGVSSTQSFTLTNSGSASATSAYVSIAGAAYALANNNCGTSGATVTIAAAGSCTFDVVFTPSGTGAANGTVSLSYNNGVATQTTPSVALTGTGVTVAVLAFSPTSKAFGTKATSSSTSQAVTITNSGGASATSVYISITGAAGYSLTSGNCGVTGTRITVAAAGTCTFNIVFAPSSAGAVSETVTLSYSDGASTQSGTMAITGTGATAASLAFSPTSKAFGNVGIGGSSTQSFTLTNSGGTSATSAYVAITGSGYALSSNNCGSFGSAVTVAAAGTCTFDVVFTPAAAASYSGTVSLSYNNGVATQTTPSVALTGAGIVAAWLAFSPSSKAFGTKTNGTSTTQSVTITNSGAVSATSIYIAVTGTAGYSLANNNCGVTGARVSLASAATCTFDIVFAPSSAGAVSETVTVSYDNSASTQTATMAITGTGATPASLAFSPTSKAFGNVTVSVATTQSFTLTNSGSASATSAYVSIAGAAYALANNNCGTSGSTVTIAAAGNCTFDVVFTPSGTGAANGTVSLSYNDGAATQTTPSVALTGTGITAASLAFSPTSKAFGTTATGSSTAQSG